MHLNNKEILEKANAAITQGDHEGFLSFCTDDTEWTFVGDKTLQGKQAVREYMATAYQEPPKFMVENLIAEGEYVTAIGTISMKNENRIMIDYTYCDVWKFRNGKMAGLKAFVIETGHHHLSYPDK
jgi:ketosteroid isomerase-like protein